MALVVARRNMTRQGRRENAAVNLRNEAGSVNASHSSSGFSQLSTVVATIFNVTLYRIYFHISPAPPS